MIKDSVQKIVYNTIGSALYYSQVYRAKSGVFNPITQTIQAIFMEDGCVIDDCKLYSVGGIKYTMIPPGTDIIIGFLGADPAYPYVVGIDPSAVVLTTVSGTMTVTASGMVVGSGVITLTTGSL